MKTIRWGMIACGAVCEIKSGPGFYKADHSALLAVTIPNPPHVQQPFIQSIVDDLNGVARCPGDPDSAARSSQVADAILHDFRAHHGYD